MTYGIGRIPADSDDDYHATQLKIEAIKKGIYPPKDTTNQSNYRRCPECGTTGRTGGYPFSTYGAMARGSRQICDDCGA